MTLTVQFHSLLAMAVAGISMAWAYDLYSWGRKLLRLRRWTTFILDVTYWVCFAVVVLLVLYRVNEGMVRIGLYAAILVGGILYFQFLSRPFLRIWDRCVALVVHIVRVIVRLLQVILWQPLVWIFTIVFGGIAWIGAGLWHVLRWAVRIVGSPLYAIYHRFVQFALAHARKIGKMIVHFVKRKPKDE